MISLCPVPVNIVPIQPYLFVQKELLSQERKTFLAIIRGLPELRKLREIVVEVYRLYDRRCRRVTALETLCKLRERLKRFKWLSEVLKKIESPTVERSLVFLEDTQLPSTSNSVERGNRRFRTYANIRNRIALDMFRDCSLPRRYQTMQSLHDTRAG